MQIDWGMMANIWEKAISILEWNLNSGLSYFITTFKFLLDFTGMSIDQYLQKKHGSKASKYGMTVAAFMAAKQAKRMTKYGHGGKPKKFKKKSKHYSHSSSSSSSSSSSDSD